MNIKKIKDGNYAGKTYTVSYEDIVDAAEAIISSVGFEYRDLQDFKANVNLVLPADVVDGAVKEAYRNSKKNVSDSRVSDDDDAFDEYFDYSEEAMEENDKVNDKCGGKRKVKDSLSEDDYEEYLNELGEDLSEDYFIIGGKKRNMPYGTALRRYDKIAFNVGYQEYLQENQDEDDDDFDEYQPFKVFEGVRLIKGFDDEDDAIAFARDYYSNYNGTQHIEVCEEDEEGVLHEPIWSSVYADSDEEFMN